MTRIAFRLAFSEQPPTITCTGCGATELQAGIGVPPDAVKTVLGSTGEPVSTVDTTRAQALCDACLRLLLAAQQR